MIKNGLKIVTIGGGSSYTPEFVEGIIKRSSELPVKELWLVDIEEGREKLEIVGGLAKRMIKKAGLDIEVHLTLNRREALKNADFVTTQLRVGQLKARALDERIPLSHGLMGQETNGAGGLFKALRTIPVILDIAKDIEELCRDAWLINFTNPAGMVTEALLKYGKHKKVIGVCNVPINMELDIAKVLEVNKEELKYDFIGLNHMVFATRIQKENQDITEKFINKGIESKNNSSMANIEALEWEPEFLRALKVVPCPYHRYYYKTKDMLCEELENFKKGETRAEIVQKVEEKLFEKYKDLNLEEKPEELSKRGGAHYSDTACNLISSIYNDKKDIQTVNTRNGNIIREFEENAAIEVSSYITKDGPKPLESVKPLPLAVRGLVGQIKNFEILAIEAAISGDYDTALLAMVTNPLIADDVKGKLILDEMLIAHKDYLPQFKDYFEKLEK